MRNHVARHRLKLTAERKTWIAHWQGPTSSLLNNKGRAGEVPQVEAETGESYRTPLALGAEKVPQPRTLQAIFIPRREDEDTHRRHSPLLVSRGVKGESMRRDSISSELMIESGSRSLQALFKATTPSSKKASPPLISVLTQPLQGA